LVILGPQGSGKGTQADLLEHQYGFTKIETGKILRKIAGTDHPWGKRIEEMMLTGVLVSDDILLVVLKEALEQNPNFGYLFDGSPRNLDQYRVIKETLEQRGEKIDKVILVDISEAETLKRISSRRTCEKCGKVYNLVTNPPPGENCECGGNLFQREDDFPDAIKKRLKAYENSTLLVVKEAEREGILIRVDGEQPIEKIHEEIVEKLGLL